MEAVHDDLGWTVFHDHIRSGDVALLSHQLQLNPRFNQVVDCWGATALHWAANCANMGAISALLRAGADVDAVCKRGESVLFWALGSGSVACCRTIIEAGANLQHTDLAGYNMLSYSVSRGIPSEEIVEFVLCLDLDWKAQDPDGTRALILASRCASPQICSMLLDAGASIDGQDDDGRSAMWDTVYLNHHANLQLFIDRGASFHVLDKEKNKFIVWAAKYADIDTMGILSKVRIEGLPMDLASLNDYWYWFDQRDGWFFGLRAPLQDEEEAFQALLESITPSSEPPHLTAVESFDIPGAFPVEPTDELDPIVASEFEVTAERMKVDHE
jgi:ankyrin repeat protein